MEDFSWILIFPFIFPVLLFWYLFREPKNINYKRLIFTLLSSNLPFWLFLYCIIYASRTNLTEDEGLIWVLIIFLDFLAVIIFIAQCFTYKRWLTRGEIKGEITNKQILIFASVYILIPIILFAAWQLFSILYIYIRY